MHTRVHLATLAAGLLLTGACGASHPAASPGDDRCTTPPNLRAVQTYDGGAVDSLNAADGWYLYSPYNSRVVQDRSEGNRRIYHADPAGLAALRAQLDAYWKQALATYEQVVEHDKED